jgi:hypothetical protein
MWAEGEERPARRHLTGEAEYSEMSMGCGKNHQMIDFSTADQSRYREVHGTDLDHIDLKNSLSDFPSE